MKTLGSVSLSARQPVDAVPLAQRSKQPGWRDPRLWIGIAIIAASVVAGAKLMASADDTTAVWTVDRDLVSGDSLSADELTSRKVRFVDPADLDRYLLASEPIADGSRITRSVGEGELLPKAALSVSLETGVIEIPINVDAGQVPPSVGAGSIVNVWVAGDPAFAEATESGRGGKASQEPTAVLVLADVVVLEAPRVADDFGAAGARQLIIGVPVDQVEDLPRALGAAASGHVVVTRQG